MKPLLPRFLPLMLAALCVVTQPLLAQGESLVQAKAPCSMHAMAVGVDSAKSDALCLSMGKCHGGCLCNGCGHCAQALMPGVLEQHTLHSVSVQLQPLVVQYTSLNPPPESPPPRSYFPC